MASADNIKKALTIQYNADVADSFLAYIKEEDFDEDTLKEDIEDVTEDDLDNCSVVEHLAGAFPNEFNEAEQKQLLKLLQNALKGILPEESTSNQLIDPGTIQWGVTKQQSKDAANYITTHCPQLMEDRERNDKALMDVVAIGKKNDIPLLNWLTDTYSRYRINNHILGKSDLNTTDWLKAYAFFTRLQQTNKTKTLEKLNSSIKSFFKRMFNQINLSNSVSMIDDNISEFVDYYIAMEEAMATLTTKQVVPFQVDLWIIPRNVISAIGGAENKEDDEEDAEDDMIEEIGVDCIGNIEHRLDANKFKYTKVENEAKEKTKRIFVRHMEQMLNEKRKQRLIIYVDRRNPQYVVSKEKCNEYVANNYGQNPADEDDEEETLAQKMKKQRASDKKKTWKDTLYFVQSPDKLFGELPSRHSAETSFWASTQCMLPKLKNEKSTQNGFGCRNDFNGYQFTLSWHCDTADCQRNYFFSNCWGTRFFPADAAQIWPTYFNQKGGKVTKNQLESLKKMEQCSDPGFKHWYEMTTKSKLVLFE